MGLFVNFLAGISEPVAPTDTIGGIVLNVPQNASSETLIRQTREMIDAINPGYVILDSGGYQLLSMELARVRTTFDPTCPLLYNRTGVNLTPHHVVNAACRIAPDILMALDRPVLKVSDKLKQDLEFKTKIGFNITWMRETAILREKYCPSSELFIPIQCYSLEQFSYIEKHLENLNYNGLALPTRNLDPSGVSMFLIKFYQMGVRKVHILSYSSFLGIPLAAYFGRHVFDWCSIDATSWRLNSDMLIYFDPDNLQSWSVNGRQPFDDAIRSRCHCPWCSYHTSGSILNLPETDRRFFLRNHNFWTVEKLCRDSYEHSRDLVSLERHLMTRSPRHQRKIEKLIHALSIVENFRSEDINLVRSMLGVDV